MSTTPPNGTATVQRQPPAGRKKSHADLLVELARPLELWHTPGGDDSDGYCTIRLRDEATGQEHAESYRLASTAFRRWLSREYYLRHKKAPGSQAMQDALAVISGQALHQGTEHAAHVRVADHAGAIYLDLCDDGWRAVEVTAAGWSIVTDPPVRFVRRRGMLPLPVPARGGSVDELRPCINIPDDGDWCLYISWQVGGLRPDRPFPVLVIAGEQGSAKTSACKLGRATTDPHKVPLRRPPRDARDLMIAACNSWIVAFDNISYLSPDLSDALCSLATGGGFGTRELWTNDDEILFSAMRPIVLNGIDGVATRPDLVDRAIVITLPTVPDSRRKTEAEVWAEYERVRPRVLGALLDAVSMALRTEANVRLPSLPRMADFAVWATAAEPSLPWPGGTFAAAYAANRAGSNAAALEGAILSAPLLALVDALGTWSGTVKELLRELDSRADDTSKRRREWPGSTRKLSADLRRLAPALRRHGIEVNIGKHGRSGTPVTIAKAPSPAAPPASTVPAPAPTRATAPPMGEQAWCQELDDAVANVGGEAESDRTGACAHPEDVADCTWEQAIAAGAKGDAWEGVEDEVLPF